MILTGTLTGLVRDQAGRLSALKMATLALMLWPGVMLAVQWRLDDLGPRPVTEVIHGTGLWAIRLLMISLAVTPARALLDWSRAVMLRRMIGVGAACYAVAHLTLFCVDHKWNMWMVVSEIALRFYLTIGFSVLLGLLTLAITSTDGWQKRLGQRWKKLHRIIYALGFLALFHYAIQSKADVSDAVFLAGLFAWLMFWRLFPRRWQSKLWPLPELALAAGLTAALVEATWYAVRNGVNPLMVLSANLDLDFGPRPAVAAAMAGAALLVAVALRRIAKRRIMPRMAMRRA
jgi:methionine sulfoxide reductase heme-binding subunit